MAHVLSSQLKPNRNEEDANHQYNVQFGGDGVGQLKYAYYYYKVPISEYDTVDANLLRTQIHLFPNRG